MKKPIEEVVEKASKGPFAVDGSGCKVIGENYYKIARCDIVGGDNLPINCEREDANAQLIAHTLNNFGPMLEALKEALDMSESEQHPADIERCLKQAIEAASTVEVSE